MTTTAPRGLPETTTTAAAHMGEVLSTVGAAPSAELITAVRAAVAANAEELEARGDDRSGERYVDVAFTFVRELRAHPELEHLDPDDAADLLEVVLTALLNSGAIEPEAPEVLPVSPWTLALGETDCFGNPMDPAERFLDLWRSMRPVPGLGGAVREARRVEAAGDPGRFGAELAAPRYTQRRVFLEVCRVLASWSEDGVFVLALYPLARALGWPRHTVGNWRSWAVTEGFLIMIAGPSRRRVAEYRLGPRTR